VTVVVTAATSGPGGRRASAAHPRLRLAVLTLLALGLLALTSAALRPAAASAAILPAQVLDGPSSSILDVDGTAMAPDGSGGIVYRKLVDGVPHVFVDQFVNGAWQPPVQADVGQAGPATMPAIAAGDGGELLVVWVQPWADVISSSGGGITYRLMSAVLQPGASNFSDVEPVDTVGDGSAVDPSLTMAPNGSAYVVYRVVTNPLSPNQVQPSGTPSPTDTGDELVDVRVARFDGAWWSGLGAVNAYEGEVSDRDPTSTNEPQIATISSSEAVVVWQEPDTTGYARIWARYIFGSTLGNAIQISPSTVNGQPVDEDADAPSLGLLGQAAFRLAGGSGSPYGSEQLLRLTVPSTGGSGADAAYAVDLGGGASVGEPDAGADIAGDSPVAVAQDGQALLYSDFGAVRTVLGPVSGDGPVLSIPDPSGGWTVAWPSATAAGLSDVEVTECYPDGSTQTGSLSAPLSGSISGLSVGNSDLADALLGWLQGPADEKQVMGSLVAAPPETFQYMQGASELPADQVQGPSGWVRPAQAKIEWAPAVAPVGSISYEVTVDGQVKANGVSGPSSTAPSLTLSPSGTAWELAEARSLSHQLPKGGLGTGAHRVRVYATDQWGQQTLVGGVNVRVDATAPTVKLTFLDHCRALRVRVTDKGSGVKPAQTSISFGKHIRTVRRKDKVTHRYSHAGRYVITITARDRVGNRRHIRVEVRIR